MSQRSAVALNKGKAPVIILSGGGTGGHIVPLLSLARAVKDLDPHATIVYIGNKGDSFGDLKDRLNDCFDNVKYIRAGKFRRYHGESILSHLLDVKTIALNVRDLFRFITSTLAALRILGTTKPDVVFSKGGFVALPVGVAAHLKHIPIVTHDSDSVPGLANRVLGRWSKVRTSGVPAGHSKHYVGNLIDSNLEKVSPNAQAASKEQLGLSSDSLVLLIAGGSSGALDINNIVTSIAERLLNSNNQLYLIHIAGSYDFVEVEQKYRATLNPDLLKRVKIYDFVNNFNELSAAADLIISRAGANAIAEFATQGKACILIPNPALAGGHQVKNAEILQASGAVEIVANNTTPENLFNVTNDLLQNKQRREELSRKIYTDKHKTAATELAKLLLHEAS